MAELLFPLQFKRQFADSLDPDSRFGTVTELNSYLSDPARYIGQVVTCDEREGKVFVLNVARDAWIEIGGTDSLSGTYVETSDFDALKSVVDVISGGYLKENDVLALIASADHVEQSDFGVLDTKVENLSSNLESNITNLETSIANITASLGDVNSSQIQQLSSFIEQNSVLALQNQTEISTIINDEFVSSETAWSSDKTLSVISNISGSGELIAENIIQLQELNAANVAMSAQILQVISNSQTISGDLDTLENITSLVDGELEQLATKSHSISGDLDLLEATVANISASLEQNTLVQIAVLSGAIDGNTSDIDGLETSVQDITSTLDNLIKDSSTGTDIIWSSNKISNEFLNTNSNVSSLESSMTALSGQIDSLPDINDSIISGGALWSSQKIVDNLENELSFIKDVTSNYTENGNVIVYDDNEEKYKRTNVRVEEIAPVSGNVGFDCINITPSSVPVSGNVGLLSQLESNDLYIDIRDGKYFLVLHIAPGIQKEIEFV